MTTTRKYAVHVSDDNGWLDGCPDHCGVFFGQIPDGASYVWPRDSEFGGHVEFATKEQAVAFADRLTRTGDWRRKSDDVERRPTYSVEAI